MASQRIFLLITVLLLTFACSGRAPGTQAISIETRGGVSLRLQEPRIVPIEQEDWTEVERQLLEPILQDQGSVPNIFKTFARHPDLFTPLLGFGRYLQQLSSLDPRDREILINRIVWLSNSEYEWSAHTLIGATHGLLDEDLQRIQEGPEAAGWNAEDAVLMAAVEELYDHAYISDGTWISLTTRFETKQIMELVMVVGGYHMLAMALNSFGVQLSEGAVGFPEGSGRTSGGPKGTGGAPNRSDQPRITPIDPENWSDSERELLTTVVVEIVDEVGFLPNVFGTLARHPELYRHWILFAEQLLWRSSLPPREREILINRIAWHTSSEYEWVAHNRIGREVGLSESELSRLAEPNTEDWSTQDAILVRAVDELHRDAFMSDATWTPLSERFDEVQMIDLVMTVGSYKMLAMALNSFGVQLDKVDTGKGFTSQKGEL